MLGYTVAYEKTGPSVGIMVAKAVGPGELTHTVATTEDAGLMASMTSQEWLGRRVTVNAGSVR